MYSTTAFFCARAEKKINVFFNGFFSTTVLSVSASAQGCQMFYFRTKKSRFGYIFGGPWNGKCGMLYDHFEYFTAIWYTNMATLYR
jgi:hypothetical protein